MGFLSANLLAVAIAARMACGAALPDEVTLAKPPSLRVELVDGRKLVGTVERFDDERFEGPIGRVPWVELAPVEAFRVRKLLASPRDKAGWLDLAAFMRSLPGGESLAQRAGVEATRLGATDAEVAAAIERGTLAAAARTGREAAMKAAGFRTGSPEAEVPPGPPWPPVDPASRPEAVKSLRAAMAPRLAATGRELVAVETDAWIAYADAGPKAAATIGVRLDPVVGVAAGVLGPFGEASPFAAKGVVAAFSDPEAFRLFEASAFRRRPGPDDRRFTHYDGPHAIVSIRTDGLSERQVEELATRGAARAILHRTGGPTRLPPWANEGLADLIAVQALGVRAPGAPDEEPLHVRLEGRLRERGLARLRNDPAATAAFAIDSYDDPRVEAALPDLEALGFLLASRLHERSPRQLAAWVKLVKEGAESRDAFRTAFGGKVETAVDDLVRWHRTND
jgi:hypothetical protein